MAGYSRQPNGKRFLIHGGMDIFRAPDLIREGFWPYLQNIRQRILGRITGRPTTGAALYTYPSAPNTIVRLNDTTPNGPASGFVRIIATDSGALYVNGTEVDSGLSGLPPSVCINQPDQSVQPWAYIADSSMATVIVSDSQQCTGMIKLRSDMLTRKTGIKEPQYPVQVSINVDSSSLWISLPANTPPWTNIGGVNADYEYNGTDTQPPYPAIIATPVGGATVQLTVTGTATVNGSVHAPGDAGPSTAGYPGDFIVSPLIVVFAFTDANGNIIAQATGIGAPPVVGNVGAAATLTVPYGAAQLQIGINSQGGHFAANSGAYFVQALVSTSAITKVSSIVGIINAAIWGDSPHSGPVSEYIWKNPNDQGTGISRTTGTAQATSSNNSLVLDSTPEDGTVPMQWSTLNSSGATIGSIPLFSPALESNGYQDFNFCLTGSLWLPQGGTYAIQIQNKDQIMFGMGGGITSTGGQVYGPLGQSMTVVSGLPLLYVSTPNGEGGAVTQTIYITAPAAGIYPFEFDGDYWYHTGRSLIVTMAPTPGAGVATIPPLPQGVRTNVQYWAKPRATETGAQGNPGPASTIQQTPVLANLITSPYQTDPQVAVMDYYRQDEGLPNPTYVITGPNDGLGPVINGIQYNTQVEDALSDIAAANNQLMQTDDYEPFPTIGVPLAGKVTIVAGVVTWKSGNKFPLNMLAGTLVLIGYPAQNAYSLVSRPTSATTIVIPDVPDTIGDASGDGVPYNIAQPILAQQATQSMWGPDAYGFFHAIDPTTNAYVWTKANNPDSAPQTNRLLLTSPSETLMGGGLINGISIVFSTEHHWLMYPNFADAQATTLGIQGNQWNPILGSGKRGMFIRNCGCALGGKAFAFRASDGIYITNGGGDESITDETLWNLFPHENFTPAPVTLGPFTVYPPNDSLYQTLTYQNGYIYWDYRDVNGNRRTLVYGEAEHGWMVDVGQHPFTAHSSEYAPNVNDTAVGCNDNSLRVLQSGGTEVCTSMVGTVPDNSGDVRAPKRVSDVFVRAVVDAAGPVTVGLYANQFLVSLSGFSPSVLTGSGALAPYIVNFGAIQPQEVIDMEAVFSWSTPSATQLDLWQPAFIPLPPTIEDQPTDWGDLGSSGANYVRGLILEADTFGQAKAIAVEDELGALHVPSQSPITLNGQQKIGMSFNPPFVSHIGRIVSSDGVTWQRGPDMGWAIQWISDPYPELTPEYTPIMEVGGPDNKFVQGVKLIADTANVPVAFQVLYDGGQIGPTFTGTFNGKQTLVFSWTPFTAHDIQLVPQSNARIWWGGVGQGVSEWVYEPYPEAANLWQTELTDFGGEGWQCAYYLNFEYISTAPITLTFTADSGNGSIAPATVLLPSSGGKHTKFETKLSPNKWKLLGFTASSSSNMTIFKEGFELWVWSWGSDGGFRRERPFGGPSASGAIV